MRRAPCICIILVSFIFNSIVGSFVQATELSLPKPGTMVRLSPAFMPAMLKGIKVYPDNPFKFEFVMDKGDGYFPVGNGRDRSLQDESKKLIKYFLAALTVPEKDLWVNLSPYEKNRIVPDAFGRTEMGCDLLAQDYMLKQITASLIYPEDETGKEFWKRVYAQAVARFGTTNISVNTFNKVWIVPEKAVVYENTKAGTAYVVESKLKVMLEEDYLSLNKNTVGAGLAPAQNNDNVRATARVAPTSNVNQIGSQIIREIIIPTLTKEINEGQNFAQLRQVYNSLILATWYKKKIKDSILAQVYADKNKIKGIDLNSTPASPAGGSLPLTSEQIYQKYLMAFKKGAYNYIKEEQDPVTKAMIPRKYFSGGFDMALVTPKFGAPALTINQDAAMVHDDGNQVVVGVLVSEAISGMRVRHRSINQAMRVDEIDVELNEFLAGRSSDERLIFLNLVRSALKLDSFEKALINAISLRMKEGKAFERAKLIDILSYVIKDKEYFNQWIMDEHAQVKMAAKDAVRYIEDGAKIFQELKNESISDVNLTPLWLVEANGKFVRYLNSPEASVRSDLNGNKARVYVELWNSGTRKFVIKRFEIIKRAQYGDMKKSMEQGWVNDYVALKWFRFLGLNVPEGALIRDNNGNLELRLEYIEGETINAIRERNEQMAQNGQEGRRQLSDSNKRELARLGLGVVSIVTDDFHQGNAILADNGRVYGFDFESSFIFQEDQNRMSRLVFNWISGNHETPPQYARDYWTGFKYYHGSGSDSSGQVYELRHLATKVALFPDQVIDEIVNHAFSFIDGNQDEVLKFLSGWKHVRNVIGYMYGIVEGNPAMLQANGVATRSDHVMGIGRTPNAESLDARTLIAQGHTATRQKEANSAQVSSDLAILGIASAITSGLPRIEEKGKDGFQKGGIDLTSDKAMQIKNDGQGGIKFHIDPAQLAQLQNAPGFMPEIISIQPMTDLKAFLGILYDFIIP